MLHWWLERKRGRREGEWKLGLGECRSLRQCVWVKQAYSGNPLCRHPSDKRQDEAQTRAYTCSNSLDKASAESWPGQIPSVITVNAVSFNMFFFFKYLHSYMENGCLSQFIEQAHKNNATLPCALFWNSRHTPVCTFPGYSLDDSANLSAFESIFSVRWLTMFAQTIPAGLNEPVGLNCLLKVVIIPFFLWC